MDRVLEIGGFAAGYCGRLFAQAGDDVVRVEPSQPHPGWVSEAASDLFLHPGKRRLQTSDRAVIRELANKADIVVVEAPDANAIAEMELDSWDTEVKVCITPFGRTGPKCNWQATSSVLLAMGGYTYIMGDAQRQPLTLPGHYVDFQSGQFAYAAATANRLAGQPNSIDLSMLEVVMSLSQFTTVLWNCTGEIRRRHGNDYWFTVPTNLFPCSDGWVYVNIVPAFWDSFTIFLDRPDLAIDDRFTTNDLRMTNRDSLHEIIAATLICLNRREIRERATLHRVPVGIVQTLDDVLADPHLAERDFWQTVEAPHIKGIHSPGPGFRFGREPGPLLSLTQMEKVDG